MKNNLKEITNILKIALQDVFKQSETLYTRNTLEKYNKIVNDFAAELDIQERNKFIKHYNKLTPKGKKIFSSFIKKTRKNGKNKDKQKILEKLLNKAKNLNQKYSIEKEKLEKKQQLKKSKDKSREKQKSKDKSKERQKDKGKNKEIANNFSAIVRDGLDAPDYIKQSPGAKNKTSILHNEELQKKISSVTGILQKAVNNKEINGFTQKNQKLGRSI
ncbi:hypothetical protein [Lyticum sinuosum]|uniref:Uncharacterized protein n=1 Tax=Lyticum sinuosum TaxID=1332059 RepID=A0AAE4VKI2_9RICK|nr:hypothetical protein [Lyticum sinuosum]MDZ5761487.1 hypothetical protein [Lyticum sinuosum]